MRAGAAFPLVLGVVGFAVAEGRSQLPTGTQVPLAISERPVLEVGVAEGDPDQQFHEVNTPFLLPDGSLVVPDAGSRTVRVFGTDGELLASHGGPGAGPGELETLSAAWARGDTIEVSDGQLRRVTGFVPDGSSEVTTLEAVPFAEAAVPQRLENGWAVVGVGAASVPGRDEIVVHRVARDGSHLGEVARLPGMVRIAYPGGGSGPDPLSPRALVAAQGDRIYVAETLTPEIRVFDAAGTLERTITWEPEPAASPREALRIVRDSARARGEAGEAPDMRQRLLEAALEVPEPDRISAFWSFIVDEEGYVWVRPYDPAEHAAALEGFGSGSYLLGGSGPGGLWRVFAPDGTELDPVRVPDELEPVTITSDAVVGIRRDALGVESVRVHIVRRR